MAKGLIGGMTDYSHQSFQDILKDIEEEKERTIEFKYQIEKNIEILTLNSYWTNTVPHVFKSIVAYSLVHYTTTITELEDIHKDLKNEVKKHHVKRLSKISKVASKINVDIGRK